MKKVRRIFITMLVSTVFLTGCSLCGNKTSARTIKNPSDMPEIVFLKITDYSDVLEEGEVEKNITFFDKNGNYYFTDDEYICDLSIEEIVNEYSCGNLDGKICLQANCEINELFKNYQKLCEVSRNEDFEIIPHDFSLGWVKERVEWYGVYYDKEGDVQRLLFHIRDAEGDRDTNDKRADEIYRSYERDFKVLTEEDWIAVLEETGEKYYNNQLIIIFRSKTKKAEIEDLVELFGAEIVSYDKSANECLIEFPDMYSLKQLKGISKSLCTYPFVEEVTLSMYDK